MYLCFKSFGGLKKHWFFQQNIHLNSFFALVSRPDLNSTLHDIIYNG